MRMLKKTVMAQAQAKTKNKKAVKKKITKKKNTK
jgi:hypothetical protein